MGSTKDRNRRGASELARLAGGITLCGALAASYMQSDANAVQSRQGPQQAKHQVQLRLPALGDFDGHDWNNVRYGAQPIRGSWGHYWSPVYPSYYGIPIGIAVCVNYQASAATPSSAES